MCVCVCVCVCVRIYIYIERERGRSRLNLGLFCASSSISWYCAPSLWDLVLGTWGTCSLVQNSLYSICSTGNRNALSLSLSLSLDIYKYIYIYIYIYIINPSDVTKGQFVKHRLTGVNSESSFSLISCYTKLKSPVWPTIHPKRI